MINAITKGKKAKIAITTVTITAIMIKKMTKLTILSNMLTLYRKSMA